MTLKAGGCLSCMKSASDLPSSALHSNMCCSRTEPCALADIPPGLSGRPYPLEQVLRRRAQACRGLHAVCAVSALFVCACRHRRGCQAACIRWNRSSADGRRSAAGCRQSSMRSEIACAAPGRPQTSHIARVRGRWVKSPAQLGRAHRSPSTCRRAGVPPCLRD